MCFSAQASFTVGFGLILLSAFAVIKAKNAKLKLLGLGPFFFGIQQLLEGLVWITLLKGDMNSPMHKVGVYGFLFFALAFWPICLPSLLYVNETNKIRKKILIILDAIGSALGILLLLALERGGVTAAIGHHHIEYTIPGFDLIIQQFHLTSIANIINNIGLVIYVSIILLPLFISSVPYMWLVGVATAAGFLVAYVSYYMAFGSVWCFFAALSSIIICYIVTRS